MALPDEWKPLIRVAERPSIIFVEDGNEIVIEDTIYVTDLNKWKEERPINSSAFVMILRHEYVHAVRQRDYVEKHWFWSLFCLNGPTGWMRRYLFDCEFRLNEEKLAYYVYIKYYQDHSRKIPTEEIAESMAHGYFGMISKEDALIWVKEASEGRWKPKKEELLEFPR